MVTDWADWAEIIRQQTGRLNEQGIQIKDLQQRMDRAEDMLFDDKPVSPPGPGGFDLVQTRLTAVRTDLERLMGLIDELLG